MPPRVAWMALLMRVVAAAALAAVLAAVVACEGGSPEARFTVNATNGQVPFTVEFTNLSKNAEQYSWIFGDGATSREREPSHTYTKAGTFTVRLLITKLFDIKNEEERSFFRQAITVERGPLDHVYLKRDGYLVEVRQARELTATAFDRFENPIPGLTYTYQASEQAGRVDNQGRFVAGTKAGFYVTGVTVEVTQGPITRSTTASITVRVGKLARLEMTGPSRPLKIGEEVSLPISAFDFHGNSIPIRGVQWSVSGPANDLSADDTLTAGNTAGTFVASASMRWAETAVTEASFSVMPDPLDHITLEPATPTVEVAQAQQFTATALDRFENPIPGLTYVFSAAEAAGRVTSDGTFTAGTSAGTYAEAVTVEVTEGSASRSASASVTVIASD